MSNHDDRSQVGDDQTNFNPNHFEYPEEQPLQEEHPHRDDSPTPSTHDDNDNTTVHHDEVAVDVENSPRPNQPASQTGGDNMEDGEEEEETEEEVEEEDDTETDVSEEEIVVDEANSRLYELLQVDPSVPAHQIFNTFKHTALRDQYKMAFNVLSDPHTKRVYDIGGESAVDHLESKAYAPFISIVGSTVSMIVYGVFWMTVTLFLILFFIFLMLHVDKWEGGGSWEWSEVLVPLYILTVLGVAGSLVLILMAILAPRNKNDSLFAYRAPFVKLLVTVGYLVFLILADSAIASDKPYDKPWMGYFVILIVVDVLSIADWMISKHPAKIRKMLEPTSEKPLTEKEAIVGRRLPNKQPRDLVFGFMFLGVFDIIVAVLRGVFLGLKIEGEINWKWYVVVIPIALRLVSSALFRLHQCRIQKFMGQRSTCSVVLAFMGTCILNGLMIASVFLICYYIHDPAHTTMVEALIPIYFVLAFLVVASIFTTIYVIVANFRVIALEKEEARGIRAAQKAFGAPASQDPTDEEGVDTEHGENGDDVPLKQMYNADNDPFNYNTHHGEPVSSMGTESVVSAETIVEEVPEDEDDGTDEIRPYLSPITLPSDQSGRTQ